MQPEKTLLLAATAVERYDEETAGQGASLISFRGVCATMKSRLVMPLLFVCLLNAAVWGQASKTQFVSQLLTIGWDTKPDARAQAENLYATGRETNPASHDAIYAYALVKMHQRQYPEAASLLEEYLAVDGAHPYAWRAKSWLSMLMKNASSSLVELDKISQLLADQKVELTASEREEFVRYLGRMIGFLEGPGEGLANAATTRAAKQKISERLTPTEREAFESAVSLVADEYAVLATAKDDAQVQEIATAERKKREELAQLDKDELDIGARKEELKLRAEKIESEVAAENDSYSKADAPLAGEFDRVAAQATAVERDLARVVIDINSVRADLAREKDPNIRDRLFRDLDRLERLAARIDVDLRGLERRAAGIKARREVLLVQHNRALAGYASSLGTAQREYKALESKEKRADAMRDKLRKPAVGNTGKVIALNKQAVALSTYETFPLEEERQRLLDLTKAK